ncbi:MAG: DUF2092 domain-containing protein [Halioglobus sp.]|nr:DUF2092 domain-containing protein [Halioglobus sp.]
MLRHITRMSMAALVIPLFWLSPLLVAQEQAAADDTAESQAYAGQRLQAMANWLAGLKEYSVTMRAGYDVLQASGQMIEFGELRDISVRRPDQARIEQQASDGVRDLLIFDGKDITVLDASSNVFAQAPTPGENLDDAIHYLLDSLGLRLPLAPMLMASFPEMLRQHVVETNLVEVTDLMGPTTDHIAVRTSEVDFQVWIAQGEEPWPLRIVINYRQLPGSPQFWANLSEWSRSPTFNQQTFVFEQPADATRIPFAAQFLTAPAADGVDTGSSEGEKP